MKKHAVVVGSGPNGLAAAIRLAESGISVTVYEASAIPGGGARSYINERFQTVHDACSAVHPLAICSPFFRRIGLVKAITFVQPEKPVGHPLYSDSEGWVDNCKGKKTFKQSLAEFAGIAAHAMCPLESPVALGTGVLLGGLAKTVGWPIIVGGTQKIVDYLLQYLSSFDAEVICDKEVTADNYEELLSNADIVLWDTDARLPWSIINGRSAAESNRKFRTAAAKIDFVTDASIPWREVDLLRAGTIHLGGTWRSIYRKEKETALGILQQRPFMLVSQPSLFDETRTPAGLHTVWSYAHVPTNEGGDLKSIMLAEMERWAPGFTETILDTKVTMPSDLEKYNPNYVGGNIFSGATTGMQFFRTGYKCKPHSRKYGNWFLCSAATLPGPGVHGMSGVLAATRALKYLTLIK